MTDLGALRARLDAAVLEADADQLPDLAAELARARWRLDDRRAQPAPEVQQGNLVDADRMAAILGDVSTNWVSDAARANRIPSLRVGHYRRFDPVAVLEAVRRGVPAQDVQSCDIKTRPEKRGGKRANAQGCPNSSAANRAEPADA